MYARADSGTAAATGASLADDFPGTKRFQILRRLGSGGMGIVYAAADRQRNEIVALKTLRSTDAAAVYRLKREFRTLADIAHPNLVTLYELIREEDLWFFTMELVEGGDFLDFVRPDGLDAARLRAALPQFVQGLIEIHRAGKLHRDLKPSNVRVTPEGRVVILDFGLSAGVLHQEDPRQTVEEGIWGTAGYMAPEQGEGEGTAASDWYALGCMLYEALTGRLPFTGTMLQVLLSKRIEDPSWPDSVRDVPEDLQRLSLDLLARAPERRPGGPDVLRRLGVSPSPHVPASPATPRAVEPLVGRARELAGLERLFAGTCKGQAATVLVHGPSGIGKSALVRQFLDRLRADQSAVVLAGRCYVRESMPYKGLDGVMDSLTRFLCGLPDAELERLLRPDLQSVLALFPVLGRVERLWELAPPGDELADPIQRRRQRFAALRELLQRICATSPVVIHVDDFQWGDADSIALLDFLLAPPDPPRLLVLASFSSEDVGSQPFLKDLLGRVGTAQVHEIGVDGLPVEETRRLAQQLLGLAARDAAADVEAIAQESAGNPFLVEQLVQYVTASPVDPTVDRAKASLGEMLEFRLARLPSGARAFLDALAIAARPIEAGVAREVAGLEGDERPLVGLLQAQRWLRATSSAERLELYHDRIRRALTAGLDHARRATIHLRLANAIETHRIDDPEALYEHYSEAGQLARAGACAARAGAQAARALAFERAALFYQRALELTPEPNPEAGEWRARLGDALASAGRVRDAAAAYASAALVAAPAEALDLRRLAGEQLLIGGRITDGLGVLGSVLAGAGLRLPKTPRRALLRLMFRRLRLRLRGLRMRQREPATIPRDLLARIDVCRTVSEGLANLDTIRAMDFQTLHLLLSLEAGEPDRAARALALEAAFAALGGGRGRRRAERLLGEAEALAERSNSSHARALCAVVAGVTAYYRGDFRRARDAMTRAEGLLLKHGVGIAWELVTTRLYHSLSLFYLGEVRELSRCARAYLRDAAERGNRFAEMVFRTGPNNVTWLVSDDVAAARRALRDALAQWPEEPFGAPHYMAMTAQARINLYAGAAQEAWDGVTQAWPGFERTALTRIEAIRIAARHVRASCALALCGAVPERRTALLPLIEKEIRRIERERAEWGLALAQLLRAAVLSLRGKSTVPQTLRAALTGFERCEMTLFAAAARRRLGDELGGDEGRALVSEVDAWMTAQGIRDPVRMTAMLAPGFRD